MATRFLTRLPDPARALGGPAATSSVGRVHAEDDDAGRSDGDGDADADVDAVLTTVPPDVYGACIVLTVRALSEGKLAKIAVAWGWVALKFAVFFSITLSIHNYMNRASAARYGRPSVVTDIVDQLQHYHSQNLMPPSTTPGDRALIELCQNQPSQPFFFAVHFLWSGRLLGQLSEARSLLESVICCPIKERRGDTVQDRDGTIVVTGLLPCDAVRFGLLLVVPKVIAAVWLWFVGTELLALSRDSSILLFKAVVLDYTTRIETEVFNDFLAPSKKEWIRRARMVQVQGRACRVLASWPSEILMLMAVTWVVYIGREIFRMEADVRRLCFACVHTCTSACSRAFSFCEDKEAYHYAGG